MHLVADENVDQQIVRHLRAEGHEVLYVAEFSPALPDEAVLDRAQRLGAVLVTADKDFGELVFRQHRLHTGVLLLRLAGFTPDQKAERVAEVLRKHSSQLASCFAVVSPGRVRIRQRTY